MSIDFLTVATIDYTPLALTTLRSARRCGSYRTFNYFVLDATPGTVESLYALLGEDADWITLFGPHDLDQGRQQFLAAFEYFNAFELSCLAKYFGASHIMRRPDAADMCVYADADVLFLADFTGACAAIGGGAGLVTPHHLRPTSDAEEVDYLAQGWLNCGFFCLRRAHPEVIQILDWLTDRISRRGFNAPDRGLFADQIWMSATLFAFPGRMKISTCPGLNVAYWNLAERDLRRDTGRFLVGTDPLIFFHFSGFDPQRPGMLSKHANISASPGSVLEVLCTSYREELDRSARSVPGLGDLERISCSQAGLDRRLRRGARKYHLGRVAPYRATDLLSRIGRRIRASFDP